MDIDGMKVKDLKAELTKLGLKTAGRKAELQARLRAAQPAAAPEPAPAATKKRKRGDNGAGEGAGDTGPPAAAVAAEEEAVAPTLKRKRGEKEQPPTAPVPAAPTPAAASAPPTAPVAAAPAKAARGSGQKRKRSVGDEAPPAELKREALEEDVKPPRPVAAAIKQEPGAPATASVSGGAAAAVVKTEPVDVKQEDAAPEEEEEEDYLPELQVFDSRKCPYLDTINRAVLDFDFEKLCCVSLADLNVYACLTCGKYFQGRGAATHAHTHSLQMGHHVYINLHTLKFYCLPDNYEVIDASLDDIVFVLRPRFTAPQIRSFDDESAKVARALDGSTYMPTIMGLNDIKANDYVNVVIQALIRVTPFRNFFLDETNFKAMTDPLLVALAELVRKLSNPRAFKSHVSPHEFLQAVTTASGKKFRMTEQSDPVEFLSWLLNTLHKKLKKKKRSVISRTFQGKLKMESRKIAPTDVKVDTSSDEYQPKITESPFLFLTLDLPPPPLFHDDGQQNIIPQVPLFELLNKYDGMTEKEYKTYNAAFMKRFALKSLPEYLVFHVTRFTKNIFFTEKNPTIINFPVQDIELQDYLEGEVPAGTCTYNLIANVVHDGQPGAGKGSYRAHVLHKGTNQWYEMQDLHVTKILPQMITLSEPYFQIWERETPVKTEDK